MNDLSHTPWLRPWVERFVAAWGQGRAPQALLLTGHQGVGKRILAAHLARRWLCAEPPPRLEPCGQCRACQLDAGEAHPDRFELTLDANERAIPIDAVRALQEELALTAHAERRVVVIHPAEAMNRFTANALLKTLEEPPRGVLFLLVSDAPGRLLPTIVSRTQQWRVAPLPFEEGRVWLRRTLAARSGTKAQYTDAQLAEALTLHQGAPLAALADLEKGRAELRSAFVRDAAERVWRQPVAVALEWAQRLKGERSGEAPLPFAELLRWFSFWLFDLIQLATLGDACRNAPNRLHYPSAASQLIAVAARRSATEWFKIAQAAARLAPWSDHPLNVGSLSETLWFTYRDGVRGE